MIKNAKLHLGCGDRYMDGYLNIDFPQSETIQSRRRRPDIETDFTKLQVEKGTIQEIHIHHVFEHFQRQVSIKLLCDWNTWLMDLGKLIISVPDIEACIAEYSTSSIQRKKQLIRHMWGSHEANWATHHEGWTCDTLNECSSACGYKNVATLKESGQWHSITMTFEKISDVNYDKISSYLSDMAYGSPDLLSSWMQNIKQKG